ncbi:uncharacterized protein Ir94d [Drosophila tropicalis]|uniref:uncharacterized protein Ir94d n=1 Tax=Drosophila tropicalis TaxID=46794 RepID=UPI0035ABAAB2
MRLWLLQFILQILLIPISSWDGAVKSLLQQLNQQQAFDYALIIQNSDIRLIELLWDLPIPVIQINKETPTIVNYELQVNHKRNLLSIACVQDEEDKISLELIRLNLKMLNTQPLLIIVDRVYDNLMMETLFEWSWQHRLLNVLIIFKNFEETGLIYSYSPFPVLQFVERRLDNEVTTRIVSPRLEDLNGYQLPIVVGGSTPRLIVRRQPDGNLVYAGLVGHLMKCFEQKYNCHLVQPMPLNESSIPPAREVIGAVRNGSVEFALAASLPSLPITGFMYPFELLSWCLMMPVPAQVPQSELYAKVFNLSAFLLTLVAMIVISITLSIALRLHGYRVHLAQFLLHDACFRGVLGQTFSEPFRPPILVRAIYLQICVLGILITSWYNSYYSTYVTSPPRLPPFTSYESILNSKTKVVVWTPEYQVLLQYTETIVKYSSIFKFISNYEVFLQLRDSFNTEYGYMMPLEKWNLIMEQQKVFSSPLFTLQENLCFYHTIPIAFPIVHNSVFREPFERLISEITATGLLEHWKRMAFTEMIEAGKLTLLDLGKPKEFRPMQLQDLET